tara:strand:+ start:459 stop:644 length:186 start_codon:yes stop_codon:yes gene_type:complete
MTDSAAIKTKIEETLKNARETKTKAEQVANQALVEIIACESKLQLLGELESPEASSVEATE